MLASRLQYLALTWFSRPKSDRVIYRAIRKHGCHRFLEIGVGQGLRAQRMIDLALASHPQDQVRYVGIDLFEARPEPASGLKLKDAHRLLKARGIATQLVPGDPFSALARTANSLRDIDLVLISADQDAASLERAWFYLPRVLHATSLVFQEQANPDGTLAVLALDRGEVEARRGNRSACAG